MHIIDTRFFFFLSHSIPLIHPFRRLWTFPCKDPQVAFASVQKLWSCEYKNYFKMKRERELAALGSSPVLGMQYVPWSLKATHLGEGEDICHICWQLCLVSIERFWFKVCPHLRWTFLQTVSNRRTCTSQGRCTFSRKARLASSSGNLRLSRSLVVCCSGMHFCRLVTRLCLTLLQLQGL